jgi:hypothetical protein
MTVDAEIQERSGGLAVLPDIGSPEAFKARIDREEQMRKILQDYVRRNMKAGHHFYTELGSTKLEKPALKQEGAHNVASLFKLIFGVPVQEEKYFDDGHYQCKTTIDVYNAQGERIATGLGICTTKESKYRWRKESRTCPTCGAPAIFKDNQSPTIAWYCWAKRDGCGAKFKKDSAEAKQIEEQKIGRIENPDLADSYNTVTKMSLKRAKVGAICQVPLVSEIFAPGEDDEDDDDNQPPAKAKAAAATSNTSAPSAPPLTPQQESFVKKAAELANKLVTTYGVEMEDLSTQFLPEGVARFEDLTEDQAEPIVGNLVELVNSKISEQKKK